MCERQAGCAHEARQEACHHPTPPFLALQVLYDCLETAMSQLTEEAVSMGRK